jgi:hypothetical protein
MKVVKYVSAMPRSRYFKYYNAAANAGGGGGGSTFINTEASGNAMDYLTINDVGSGTFITKIEVNAEDPQTLDVTRSNSSGGVDKIVAGSNVSISPTTGVGNVTISAATGITSVTYSGDSTANYDLLSDAGSVSGSTYQARYRTLTAGSNVSLSSSGSSIVISASGGSGINFSSSGSGYYVKDMSYTSSTNTLTETLGNPSFTTTTGAVFSDGNNVVSGVSFNTSTGNFTYTQQQLNFLDFTSVSARIIGGVTWRGYALDSSRHGNSLTYFFPGNSSYPDSLLFNTNKIMAFNWNNGNMSNLYLNPNGGSAGMNYYVYISPNGDVYYTGNLNQSSDERLKNDINDIENGNVILNLKPVQYHLMGSDKINFGLIAQDVEKVIPNIVNTQILDENSKRTDKDDNEMTDVKSIDYIQLIPLMIKQIQEQEARIKQLELMVNG